MLSLTVRGTARSFTHPIADAGGAVSVEGVAAGLDEAASEGRYGADSDVGSGISALSSCRPSANSTLFNARPVGASPTRLAAVRRQAFTSSVFLFSPSTRIRHSSVWPCARPPLTDALQPRQRSDVPYAMKSLCLRYSLLGTGSRFGSGGKTSARCLSKRCAAGFDFSPSSSKSAAEKGYLGHDFPSDVSVGSLDRPDYAEPPVKVYHDAARRQEAESKQPRLCASRIELVHSFQDNVSELHTFTETCQRRAKLAPL